MKSKILKRTQLVYDLPLRLFHWVFAGLFLSTFAITKIFDNESLTFTFHMLLGLTLFLALVLRLVWGFAGTQNSLFKSFQLHPQKLKAYFLGIISGKSPLSAGHNPASSWAAVTMFILSLGLGVTGFLMTSQDARKTFEDVHELMANAFLVVAILHVLGVIFHTIRHKEIVGLSMIDGKKAATQDGAGSVQIAKRPVVATIFVVLVAGFGAYLWKSYDQQNRVLGVFGLQLHLGEDEAAKSKSLPEGDND